MSAGSGGLGPGIVESPSSAGPAPRTTLPLFLLYAVWAVTLFDLQYFFGNVVWSPLGRLGTVVYIPLLIMIAVRAPIYAAASRGWVWYPPLMMLLLSAVVTAPFATNTGFARLVVIQLFLYNVLAFASVVVVRTARQAIPILLMIVWQFVWWAGWGRTNGLVAWHPTLANYDGFGAFMVQGAGICFWFGMAARSKQLKLLAFVLAAYCVSGVVASFARGAFVSLVAIAGLIWARSPRKVMTAAGGIAGGLIVVGAAALLFPGGAFWNEIRSVFQEGTEEGTGGMRWDLAVAALRVWKEHPIFGVGGGNFGAFGTAFFRPDELAGFENPGVLYGLNVHNSYLQVLSELGLVGTIGFIWVFVDFHRRNRALLKPDAIERWKARTGGRFDLRYLALGIETANAANMLSGLFYASLFFPWFYTTWALNRMLWAVTRPDNKPGAARSSPAGSSLSRRDR